MTTRRVMVALGAVVLVGAAAYGLTRAGPDPVADLPPATECDSCSARKKDMQRLQGVLNPPDAVQE